MGKIYQIKIQEDKKNDGSLQLLKMHHTAMNQIHKFHAKLMILEVEQIDFFQIVKSVEYVTIMGMTG